MALVLDETALKGLEARIRILREGERHVVGPPTIAVGVDLLEMLVATARTAKAGSQKTPTE